MNRSANAAGTSRAVGSSAAKLSFISVFLLGINGVIGSGTFLLPQEIYQDSGFMLGMGVILVAGIATTLIAFCYADLSGKFSGGGGAWLYAYTSFGKFTGYQVGFFMWFAGIVAIGAAVAALIRVFKNVIPALGNDVLAIVCGTVLIVILGAINWFGLKSIKWVNNLSSGIKLATAAFFVVAGVFFLKFANFTTTIPSHASDSLGTDVAATYAVVFYMFTGFSFLPIAARRMRNPRKDLPRALLLVMLTVTLIYLLVQFVTVGILGDETAKTTIPVASAMQHTLGDWGYYIIIVGSAVSIFGLAFSSSFDVPLIASTLAEEHKLLPAFFAKQNRFGAPVISILLTVAVSSILLWTGSYVFLATCMVCANFVQYVPTILSVVRLRKMPSQKGSLALKGPWAWIVAGLALVSAAYVLVGFTWKVVLVAAATFVVATITYFIDRWYRAKKGIEDEQSGTFAERVARAAAEAEGAPTPTSEPR